MAEGGKLARQDGRALSTADCPEDSDQNDNSKRRRPKSVPVLLGDTWIPPSPVSTLSPDKQQKDESKFQRLEKSLHDFKLGLLKKYWKDFERFIHKKHPEFTVELTNQRIVLTGPENISGRENFLESFLQSCLKKELKVLNTEVLVEFVTKKNPKAYIDSVLQDKKVDCYWSKCSENKGYVQIYATTQKVAENAAAVISLCAFRLELIREFLDQFMYYMEKEFPLITTKKDEVGCPIVTDEDDLVTHLYLERYIEQLFQKVYDFPSSLHAEFFCSKDSQDNFSKKLKKQNITCFWCKDPYDDVDTQCIKVYVQTEEDIEKIFQLIKKSSADYSVIVTSDERQLLDKKLNDLTHQNESKYVFRVREENTPNRYKYTFVGFTEATKAIEKSMEEVTLQSRPSEEHRLSQVNLINDPAPTSLRRNRLTSGRQSKLLKRKSDKIRPHSCGPVSTRDEAKPFTERLVWKGGDFPFHKAEKRLNPYCKFTHVEGIVCESELTLMDKYTFVYKNKKILIQEGCIADSWAHLIMCPVNKDLKEFGVGTNIFERGGQEQLKVGIYSVISLSKQQEFGTCHFSEETGTLACREICYVVLPESATEQPSQLTRFVSSCVTKMMEHSEKKFYKSVAMCVDFMNTKDKRSNSDLINTFVTAVKKSNFQKSTKLFQGPLKNVLEIHLIAQSQVAVDCLKTGLEKSKSIKATHILDMSHSQFNLKDELLLKSPIAVKKISGSLTDQELLQVHDVDMVVNSIDPSCMFETGLVNRNIFHAAGPQIRDELRQNYPELLKPGEVAVTSACKLPCKKICHGLLYQGWDDISLKLMRSIIIKSLKKADEYGFATVAFPALGTGTLGYPWQHVANTMVECIDQYGKSNPNTKVKTVVFALYREDKPTQQAFANVFNRWQKFPNCSSFYAQKVQRNLDKEEPFIVSVDPKGVGKFHVIPSYLIGVCFDVDIIFTFIDSQGFEDSVEKCNLQQPLQETWKFDEVKNVFDVLIQLDKDAMRSSENLLSQAVKNCLLAMDIHKFTSLAIRVKETGFIDVCKRIELLAKLIQKQKGEKKLNVYFIVDQETDYEHSLLKPLNSNTRGLVWHLKHRALRNYTMPAVEISLEANSQEKGQEAVDLLQRLKNETCQETRPHTLLDMHSLQLSQSAKRLSNALEEIQGQEDAEDEETPSELLECCFEGNLEKMKELMQRLDTDEINQPDSEGDTAVHCCAHWKNEEILQMLLERSDVDLNNVNMNGMTPLEICMEEEAEECAKLLVQKGCDVNIVNTDGNILLHMAIVQSNSKIVQIVLSSQTADFRKVNSDGLNALMWATLKNNTEAVDLILERDKGFVNVQTQEGYTPVHAAATNNFMEVASILLTKGDVDTKLADNEQKTPLHNAVNQGFESMIDLLVFKGYDVNAQDCDGNTPLHIAQKCSERDPQETCDRYVRDRKNTARILCHLIELRANIHMKNNEGITPLEGISDYLTQQFIVTLSATVNSSAQALSQGGITLPCHWLPMEGKRYRKIPLDPDKPGLMQMEYRDIEALFMESFQAAKVLSICRVQNPYLWEHFILKKKNMERQYGKGCSNEKELFHGTRHTNIERICEENLAMCRASERTGAILGLGVYFALESQTSDLYCTSRKDGKKFVMVMRVAVGKVCKGNQSYKKPPPINPGDPDSNLIYDSCVDSVDRPKVFCLFDPNQYYPDYVVEYTTQ